MITNSTKNSGYIRWIFIVLVSLIFAGNHYSRDTPGALEKELENDIRDFSSRDYSLINSLYFFPNMITPLFAGMLIDTFGGIHNSFLLATCIAGLGHVSFAIGVQYQLKPIIFIGKFLSGSMYEVIDCVMAVTYLTPIFQEDYQVIIAIQQFFVRLGSVINFFLSPWLYEKYGLNVTIWVSSIIGASSIVIFLLAWYMEKTCLQLPSNDNPTDILDTSLHKIHSDSATTIESESDSEEEGWEEDLAEYDDYDALEQAPRKTTHHKHHHPHHETTTLLTSVSQAWSHLSPQYHCCAIAGACLYGCIVPFWFCGSKYLQDMFALTVSTADMIMTIPETMIILVGVPIGIMIGRYNWSKVMKLHAFAYALVVMMLGYAMLLVTAICYPSNLTNTWSVGQILAIAGVTVLGCGFAFGCQLFWGTINQMVSLQHLSMATGIVSCEVNLLPSLIPPILASIRLPMRSTEVEEEEYWHEHMVIAVLIGIAGVGAVSAYLAMRYEVLCPINNTIDNENDTNSSANSTVGGAVSYAKIQQQDDDNDNDNDNSDDDGEESSGYDDEEDDMQYKHQIANKQVKKKKKRKKKEYGQQEYEMIAFSSPDDDDDEED